MEFLNNIWTAISTPNELLTNFCIAILILLVEAPLTFYLISNVFNIKFNKKQRIIYIVSSGIIAVIANFFIDWPFNIIFNYAFAFTLLFFIMKVSFIKSFIATLFPSIVFNLVVNLLANPYLELLHITYEQNNTIIIYRIPFVLLTYLIVFVFNIILKYRKVTLTILDNFDKKNKNNYNFKFYLWILKHFFTGIIKC